MGANPWPRSMALTPSAPILFTAEVDRMASPLFALTMVSSGANGLASPTIPPIWNLGCWADMMASWAAPMAPIAPMAKGPSGATATTFLAVSITTSAMEAAFRIPKAISSVSFVLAPKVSTIWAAVSNPVPNCPTINIAALASASFRSFTDSKCWASTSPILEDTLSMLSIWTWNTSFSASILAFFISSVIWSLRT